MLVGKDASLTLTELPRFAHEQLGLHGLMLSADLLAGRTRDDLARLRDAADRARCSCLVLMEEDPQKLAAADGSAADERIRRVMAAASLLGCNAAGVAIEAPEGPEALDRVADRLKRLMSEAEQREINLLIMPGPMADAPGNGLTASPDRLTELLKKVGGFRVGTMPDFAHAAKATDMPAYLRKVTPYASAVLGSTLGFNAIEGELDDERAIVEHQGFDLAAAVEAIAAVGYDGAVGLDFQGPGDPNIGLRRSREAFTLAMEGKRGPFSLVHDDEEFDDEMDAAAAALLDAIFNDEAEEDDDEDEDDAPKRKASVDDDDATDPDPDPDPDDDPAPVEEDPRPVTKRKKSTTKKAASADAEALPKKKTTRKTSKKTSKKTKSKADPKASRDDAQDGDEP